MGDETANTMNLDLNLGPAPEPAAGSAPNEHVSLDDWIDDPAYRWSETMRLRASQRRRWRQLHTMPQSQVIAMDLNQLLVNSGNVMIQAGEGSVTAEGRTEEIPKTCDNTGVTVDKASEDKADVEKCDVNDGSFFDCNVCLDLAKDPVVTCCGHLFCWSCLYRWLHVHSDAKECPVCKGEVSTKNVTPIYGRGSYRPKSEEDPSLNIPCRPQARRVESLRQTIQRNASSVLPVEEMIRRLGRRIDLRTVSQTNELDVRESAQRRTPSSNGFMASQGPHREQNLGAIPDEAVDLTQSSLGENHRLQSIFLHRARAQRTNPTSLSSALNSAERLVEAYFHSHHMGRNQEQAPTVDDRDSFSSIGVLLNSESQMDTATEIDSLVSLSTSSSRRRTDASRVSDVDMENPRAPRRRRLNRE